MGLDARVLCRAVVVTLFLLAPAAAIAQIGEAVAGTAIAACGELVNAVKAAPDAPPRLADPHVKLLFALALPEAAVTGPVAGVSEFALLNEMSTHAGRLARAYILAGTGTAGQTGREEALNGAQRDRAGRNIVDFLPEIARLYDFRLRVAARLAAGAAAFEARAPQTTSHEADVRPGLEVIETETRAMLAAYLSLASDANIDSRWRLERMRVLVRLTPSFAAFLAVEPSQRLADQALAAAIREHDPAVGELLKSFALAILR